MDRIVGFARAPATAILRPPSTFASKKKINGLRAKLSDDNDPLLQTAINAASLRFQETRRLGKLITLSFSLRHFIEHITEDLSNKFVFSYGISYINYNVSFLHYVGPSLLLDYRPPCIFSPPRTNEPCLWTIPVHLDSEFGFQSLIPSSAAFGIRWTWASCFSSCWKVPHGKVWFLLGSYLQGWSLLFITWPFELSVLSIICLSSSPKGVLRTINFAWMHLYMKSKVYIPHQEILPEYQIVSFFSMASLSFFFFPGITLFFDVSRIMMFSVVEYQCDYCLHMQSLFS